jgi:hypothetical protein
MYHRASWSSSPSLPARSDDDYLPTGYDLPTRTSQGQKGDERDTGDKLNQGHIGSVFAILAATDSDVTYKVDNQAINQRAKAIDEELMNKYSDEINRYLETANGRKRESIPWIDCPTSTLEEVENYVNLKFDHPTASFEGQGSDSLEALIEGSGSGLPEPVIESSGSGSPKTIIEASDYALPVSDDDDWYPVRPVRHEAIYLERGYKKWHSEDLKSYFEAAKTILAIFYPLGYTNSVTAKYWGAINRHLRWSKNRGLGMTDLLRDTHLVARTCKKIVHDLFIKHDCTAVEIPKEFLEAWIQCLMHFFLLSVPKARRSTQHLLSCMTLLKRGKRKVLQGLYTGQLQRRGVVSPTGIACVLISSLPSPGLHGLIDTYWTPLQKLVC